MAIDFICIFFEFSVVIVQLELGELEKIYLFNTLLLCVYTA